MSERAQQFKVDENSKKRSLKQSESFAVEVTGAWPDRELGRARQNVKSRTRSPGLCHGVGGPR